MLGGDIGRKRRQRLGAGARHRDDHGSQARCKPARRDDEARPDAQASKRCSPRSSPRRTQPRSGKSGAITTGLCANGSPAPRRRSPSRAGAPRLGFATSGAPPRRWNAARLCSPSPSAILAAFAEAKAERGALDFDDQIARALALVTRSSAAWVHAQARLCARPPARRRGAGHVAPSNGASVEALTRGVFRGRRRAPASTARSSPSATRSSRSSPSRARRRRNSPR